jgi:hypothetical protein
VSEQKVAKSGKGGSEKVSSFADAASLRDHIKNVADDSYEDIVVSEWKGAVVRITSMSGTERSSLLEMATEESGRLNLVTLYPELIIRTARHPETGEALFTKDDASWLNDKSGRALEQLAQAALRRAGLDRESVAAMGKGSESTPNGDSTSN